MATEDDLLARLERWLAARAEPPTIFDVIETRDGALIGAFILKGFRAAAKQAVVHRLQREAAVTFADEATGMTAVVLRVAEGIADAWSLKEDEKLELLGLSTGADLQELRVSPLDEVPTEIVERVAILLDIFKAINTLLPQPDRADAWIRAPNNAPMFGGRSALEVMTSLGLEGLREVRAYLNAQIWAS